MATIQFNSATFRALCPPYADVNSFPDPILLIYWDSASDFINICYSALKPKSLTLAMNLLTAHLLALAQITNDGQVTSLVQGATIDKVTVQLTPPPQVNQWQWWLNQTSWGQQLLALLAVKSVGGWYQDTRPPFYLR